MFMNKFILYTKNSFYKNIIFNADKEINYKFYFVSLFLKLI